MGRLYRKMWKENKGVSPVIATIMMVAVTVVLVGVLVVYMSSFTTQNPTSAMSLATTTDSFTNPYDTQTTNMGGWTLSVASISGDAPDLQQLVITIKTGGVAVATFDLSTNTAIVQGQTGNVKWYVVPSGTAQFYDASASSVTAVSSSATIESSEFRSIENAYMVVLDNDGDGKLTPGDAVMVFRDNTGDGTADLNSGDVVEFKYSGQIIASPSL